MAKSNIAADGVQDWLARVLYAAVAAWLAISINSFLFSNYGESRLWETWVAAGSPLARWVPLVAFAFITGLTVGVAIALVFPKERALKIGAIAALLQFAEGVATGNIASSLVLALALVLGSLPSRVAR